MIDTAERQITVKRTTCDRYDISGPRNWWATIAVGSDGQVLIQSDYGEWAHWWGSPGPRGIKPFLVEINEGYLIDKLSKGRRVLNLEKTLDGIRRQIVKLRREGDIKKDAARDAWERLPGIDASSPDAFWHEFGSCRDLTKVFPEYWEWIDVVTEPENGLIQFAQRAWPVFVEHLRQEIRGVK